MTGCQVQGGVISTVHHIDSCPPHDQHLNHSRAALSAGPVQGREAMIIPLEEGAMVTDLEVGWGQRLFVTGKTYSPSAYLPWETLPLQDFDSHSCQQFPKLSNSDIPLSFKPNQPPPEISRSPYNSLSAPPSPTSLLSLACPVSLNSSILYLVSSVPLLQYLLALSVFHCILYIPPT